MTMAKGKLTGTTNIPAIRLIPPSNSSRVVTQAMRCDAGTPMDERIVAKFSGPRLSFAYPCAAKPNPITSLSGKSAHSFDIFLRNTKPKASSLLRTSNPRRSCSNASRWALVHQGRHDLDEHRNEHTEPRCVFQRGCCQLAQERFVWQLEPRSLASLYWIRILFLN